MTDHYKPRDAGPVMRAPMSLRIHDTNLSLWQDSANDPTYRSQVFHGLIAFLRRYGWWVRLDPKVCRDYPSIGHDHRVAAHGTLRAAMEIGGRTIQIEFWATTWPRDNRNGPRFDFDRLRRMSYLDRQRFRLTCQRIITWLGSLGPVDVEGEPPATALEFIAADYARSAHKDKTLGRPVCNDPRNARSADGEQVEHGSTVWFRQNGRWMRGTAYYHLNNMWWVVSGRYSQRNLSSGALHCRQPTNLREKRDDRRRRARLEAELQRAVRRMDFRRAEILKHVLFPASEAVFLIWCRENNAYYRPNYSGYTADTIAAGRYTEAEMAQEVGSHPKKLEGRTLDGRAVTFDQHGRRAA